MITQGKKDINRTQRVHPERLLKNQKHLKPRPVTAAEFCQVNFVTVREGVNHCRWPKDVIEQFLAAEA